MTRIASPVIKRSIVRDGHKSSVSLEDEFWDALREIADRENMTMSALVATFDHGADNLSSAIRVFVLDHFRRNGEHTPARRPNQTRCRKDNRTSSVPDGCLNRAVKRTQ